MKNTSTMLGLSEREAVVARALSQVSHVSVKWHAHIVYTFSAVFPAV